MKAPSAFLVIGAAHWDTIGRAAGSLLRTGADCPGRVVRRPGGVALNIAVALAATGKPVRLCAVIGRDPEGDELVRRIEASGIGCSGLIRTDGATDSYVAIETDSGMLLGAVANCSLLETYAVDLLEAGRALVERPGSGDVVLDGNLPEAALAPFLSGVEAPVSLLAASPAKAARLSRLPERHRITLYANRTEAEALLGSGSFPDAASAARALRLAGFVRAVVTDSTRPAASAGPDYLHISEPPAAAVLRVTGAGDAFAAAHIFALADGMDPENALEAALAAAARHISSDTP